jgi:alpha-ribazole phosphatase
MTRLILTRHGETDWNAARRFQGHTDIPLNERGHQQARAVGNALASKKIDVAFASDLQRTQETAQAILVHHKVDLVLAPRLREMSFGAWEGLTYAEMCAQDDRAAADWGHFMLTLGPPDGEAIPIFAARIKTFLDEISVEYPDKTVLLVVHGGVIRMALCTLLGIPLEKHWQFNIRQTSLTEIETFPEGAILNLFNDDCHLNRERDT